MADNPHVYCVRQLELAYKALDEGKPDSAKAYIRGAVSQLTGALPEGAVVRDFAEVHFERPPD